MFFRASIFAVFLTVFMGLGASTASSSKPKPGACPADMTCGKVTVPLDWTGKRLGKLKLPMRVTKGKGPVLLYLSGGPGQSTTPHTEYIRSWFDALAPEYRIAIMDQRGTGATAIRCDRLQRLFITDLTVRPRAAVRACGKRLGQKRAFYSTTSTVRDMEAVRKVIGTSQMAVMGTSYGTYVAERYARAFPKRVSRLILDSVVPQEDVDPFLRVHMRRAGKILRWECGKGRCGFRSDPAADLAKLVGKKPRRLKVPGKPIKLRVDGSALIDWVTTIFSFQPKEIPTFGRAIHRAARGDYRLLMRVAWDARQLAEPAPADDLSWGLHAATLCSDAGFPFSIGQGNRKSRSVASARYLSKVPRGHFWPFNRATALGNGIPQTCFDWQRTTVKAPPKPGRLIQPTLFLAGQYDLSTPIEYARRELRRAPKGKLVVVPKAGHAVAFQRRCSARAVSAFLAAKLKRDPCRSK